ncbi:DUF6223 family protein [Nonomuraea sp. NPDC049684]|uniref:DUF6223 family protein n=1 Tax=Nonomuraea sp. NPDC049684 TaxID=3364356 RepID=UPI00379316A4
MFIDHLLAAQADPVAAYAMTTGRMWSLIAAGVGLAGIAAGGLALARSTGRLPRRTTPGTGNGPGTGPGTGTGTGTGTVPATGKRGAVVALAAGVTSIVIGGWVIGAAKGGPGTGYGIVGGYLDLILGLAAVVLGVLVLNRARRPT